MLQPWEKGLMGTTLQDHLFPVRRLSLTVAVPAILARSPLPRNDHRLPAHGFADHRERLLPSLIVGADVIRRIEETFIDLRARHEAVDFDRVIALDRDRV